MKQLFVLFAFLLSMVRVCPAPGDENWESGFVLPPGVDGEVNAMAVIGSDVFVGGRFEKAGDVVVNSLARWDGTNWHSVGKGVHGIIFALAISGTNLYVGGEFDRAGTVPATNLARWNGSSWDAIGDVEGRDFTSFGVVRVMSLLASRQDLFVSGSFREVSGVAATNIAKWDGTTWSPLGPGLGSDGGYVGRLAKIGSRLYAGGLFLNAGGVRATNIAYWNGRHWRSLSGGASGGPRGFRFANGIIDFGSVFSLAVRNGVLFVGGQFTRAGNAPATNLARWSGSRWLHAGSGVGDQSSAVTCLATRGRELCVAGGFQFVSGVAATNIARWDGRHWRPLGPGVNGSASAMSFVGSNLFVGGDFGIAGNASAAHVARWNGAQWSALGEGSGNTILGSPTTIAATDEKVFVTGFLHTAGTNRVNDIACWNGTNWSTTVGALLYGAVRRSAAIGTNYYVGGFFELPGIGPATVACWNGTAWRRLGEELRRADGTTSTIGGMTTQGSCLYVGGDFSTSGSMPITNVAVWNGSAWSQVGADPPIVPPLAYSQLMVADARNLFVVGQGYQLWRWDGTNWTSFGIADGGEIQSIGLFRGDVYVGGHFSGVNGISATNIARWNGSDWSAVNFPFHSAFIPALVGDRWLYVGGRLDAAMNAASLVARYDGTNWLCLGSGLAGRDNTGYVVGLGLSKGKLFATGFFNSAGGKPSYRFAAWNETD